MSTTTEIIAGLKRNPEFTTISSPADLEKLFAHTPGTDIFTKIKARKGRFFGEDYNGWAIARAMLNQFETVNRWTAGYEELVSAEFSSDDSGTRGCTRRLVCTISRLYTIVGGAETIEIKEYDGTTIIRTHDIPTTPESIAIDLAKAIDEYSL